MRWTAEEDAKVHELLALDLNYKQIAERISRPYSSTKEHIRWLFMTEEQKEWRRERIRSGRRNGKDIVRRVEEYSTREAKPQHVFEDAARRAEAPRTLTAVLMGDPPIGFSALDRRQA